MTTTLSELAIEMLERSMRTAEILLAADEKAMLPTPTSHVCGHGKDTWVLLSNLIDHETKHIQQVLQGRYETKESRTPLERLVGEWLEVRARFISAMVGLNDAQLTSPAEHDGWTYREIAQHLLDLEQDALRTMAKDGALPVGDR